MRFDPVTTVGIRRRSGGRRSRRALLAAAGWIAAVLPGLSQSFDLVAKIDGLLPSSLAQGADRAVYAAAAGDLAGTGPGSWRIVRMAEDTYKVTTVHASPGQPGLQPPAALAVAGDGAVFGAWNDGSPGAASVLFRCSPRNGSYAEQGVLGVTTVGRWSAGAYGVLYATGASGAGAPYTFGVKTNGSGFARLAALAAAPPGPAPLVLPGPDGRLYGVSGEELYGIHCNGSGRRTLHSFGSVPGDAADPQSLAWGGDGSVYGAGASGGRTGTGALFRIQADGSNYSILHSFDGTAEGGVTPGPALLVGDDGFLYGFSPASPSVTAQGARLFRVNRDGAQFQSYAVPDPVAAPDPKTAFVQGADGGVYYATAGGIARFSLADRITVVAPPTLAVTNGATFAYHLPGQTFQDPRHGPPLTVSACWLPEGVAFNPQTRSLSGAILAPGSYCVLITATDPATAGRSASATIPIVVLPDDGVMMTDVLPNFDGTVTVQGFGPPGERYAVFSAPAADGPWTLIRMATVDGRGQIQVLDPNAKLRGSRFFNAVWTP